MPDDNPILENPPARLRRDADELPPEIVVNGTQLMDREEVYRRKHFAPSGFLEVQAGDLPGLHFAAIRDINDPAELRETNDPVVNLLNDITEGYTYGKDISGLSQDVERLITNLSMRSAMLTAIGFTVDMRRYSRFSKVREIIEDWLCTAATRRDLTTAEALQMNTYINSQMPALESKLAEGPPPSASFQNPSIAVEQTNYATVEYQRELDKQHPDISMQDHEMVSRMVDKKRLELRAILDDLEASKKEHPEVAKKPLPKKKAAKSVKRKPVLGTQKKN